MHTYMYTYIHTDTTPTHIHVMLMMMIAVYLQIRNMDEVTIHEIRQHKQRVSKPEYIHVYMYGHMCVCVFVHATSQHKHAFNSPKSCMRPHNTSMCLILPKAVEKQEADC